MSDNIMIDDYEGIQSMSQPTIEQVFNNLSTEIKANRERAHELHVASTTTEDDTERARLREERDYLLRVADQNIALMGAQGQMMTFLAIRDNLAEVIDSMNAMVRSASRRTSRT